MGTLRTVLAVTTEQLPYRKHESKKVKGDFKPTGSTSTAARQEAEYMNKEQLEELEEHLTEGELEVKGSGPGIYTVFFEVFTCTSAGVRAAGASLSVPATSSYEAAKEVIQRTRPKSISIFSITKPLSRWS